MSRFDKEAENWDDRVALQELADATKQTCYDLMGYPAARALDFGTGTGLVAAKLLDPNNPVALRVVGVDPSVGMVNQFTQKAKRFAENQMVAVNCKLESDTSLKDAMKDFPEDVPRKSFDLITSQLAYHHIHDITNMTKVLSTYLSPGGLLCIIDYQKTPESVKFHPKAKLTDPDDVCHPEGFSAEEFKAAFEAAGLVDVKVQTIHTMYKKFQDSDHLDKQGLKQARDNGETLLEFPILAASGKRRAFIR